MTNENKLRAENIKLRILLHNADSLRETNEVNEKILIRGRLLQVESSQFEREMIGESGKKFDWNLLELVDVPIKVEEVAEEQKLELVK